MIEAIFFAVPRNAELKLGAILFSPLADSASVEGVLRRLAFFRTFAVGYQLRFASAVSNKSGSEENEIVEERNQDRGFCAQGTQEQFKDKGRQAHKSKPFDF